MPEEKAAHRDGQLPLQSALAGGTYFRAPQTRVRLDKSETANPTGFMRDLGAVDVCHHDFSLARQRPTRNAG